MSSIRKKMVIQPENTLTIQEGLDEFVKQCKVQNYVPETISNYIYTMKKFGKFFDLSNLLSDINIEILNSYIISLQDESITEYSVMTYTKNIRAILYYFMMKGWLSEFKIKLPKAEKKLKEVYSDSELKRLLKKPDIKKCGFSEYRNWVAINFLIGTGVRLASLINIKVRDLDFNNEIIKLTKTKGRKQVFIPITGTLIEILKEYLRLRAGEDEDYLFCSQFGEQLKADCMKNNIQRYNKSRGVDKTSIHLFRHSYAQRYLLSGGDVFRLQKLMCHSDLRSTKEYLELCTDDLKVNYDRFNPLEQLVEKKKHIKLR